MKTAVSNSFSYLFAYRVDVIMKILLGLGWTAVNLLIIEVLFLHTTALNGWSKIDMVVLFLTFGFATEIGFFLGSNIKELETAVRRGSFDGIITKPIDSQFLSVFGRPDFSTIIYLSSRQAPYLYILWRDGIETSLASLLLYIFLILCGNIIWLSVRVMLMTLNFWHQKLDNLADLQNTIDQFAQYPIGIFPRSMQLIMYTAMPLAFVAFVPAEALRGNISAEMIMLTVAMTIIFVTASRLLWKKALKNYTSASS